MFDKKQILNRQTTILKDHKKVKLQKLIKEAGEAGRILSTAKTLEEARSRIFKYINELEYQLLNKTEKSNRNIIDDWLTMETIKILKKIFSKTSEEKAGFSTLKTLWILMRKPEENLDKISETFISEFIHLFSALNGRTRYGDGWMKIKYTARRGGEGVRRSRFLDQMWMKMRKYLERYRSGLDPEIINIRMENKRRILQLLSGSEDDWKNYKWHFKNVFKGEEGLRQIIKLKVKLSEEEVDAISKAVENQISWGITPYYLHLFQFNGKTMEDLQVRKQVIPSRFYVSKMIEHLDEKETYFDFMGEHDTTPCNLITRRYVTIAFRNC